MSERPIEEVIGWTRQTWRPGLIHPYDSAPVWDTAVAGADSCEATVDDLAAWLDARLSPTWAWSLHHWLAGPESRFCCHGYEDRDHPASTYQWDTEDFSTIREALIAAIRKVAES